MSDEKNPAPASKAGEAKADAPGSTAADALRLLAEASERYAQTVQEAQSAAAKEYYALLNGLAQTVQTIAQDRSAADMIARYQHEALRRLQPQGMADASQQYVDTVQGLLKVNAAHGTTLREAMAGLQTKTSQLGEACSRTAEKAAQEYAQAVSAVAKDNALRELDAGMLARLGYGVLAAALIKAQAASPLGAA